MGKTINFYPVDERDLEAYCQREFGKSLEEQILFIKNEYLLKMMNTIREEKATMRGMLGI